MGKVIVSAAIEEQAAKQLRDIAATADRSLSWVVSNALNWWIGSGRQLAQGAFAAPLDRDFERVFDGHLVRLLGTNGRQMERAKRIALAAACRHFGIAHTPGVEPDEGDAETVDPTPTTSARGKRAATQETN